MGDQFQFKKLIWPDIKTDGAAKTARLPALVFSILSACLWAAIMVATVLGHKSIYGNLVFLHLTVFVIISIGLFKMRRDASIAYLVLCIAGAIFSLGHPVKLVAEIAGVLVSVLAIRGTFSYANLVKSGAES